MDDDTEVTAPYTYYSDPIPGSSSSSGKQEGNLDDVLATITLVLEKQGQLTSRLERVEAGLGMLRKDMREIKSLLQTLTSMRGINENKELRSGPRNH